MEVMCVNIDGRPSDHPISKWLKKDTLYTVIESTTVHPQNILAFKLAEIDTDGLTHEFFRADRFAVIEDISDHILEEQLEDVTELSFQTNF